MLFTDYKYFVFLLGAFCVYYLAGRLLRRAGAQNLVLVALGYGFYAFWNWKWLFLLAGITATGYGGALLLGRWPVRRTIVLVGVLVLDLAALGVLKYFDFFADSLATLFGAHADWVTLHLALPVGVSYYVFQNLSYVIDVYRGRLVPTRSLVAYSASLSFFPALLAGPITRPRDLLPQLEAGHRVFDDDLSRDGVRQLLWGLVKKMIVADMIGTHVDKVWENLGAADGLTLVMCAVLYSIQIYCDFSGYADIAIGSGKLFGLRLSKNFDYPYFSTSVRVFWRRWHITLGSWMRDYVYISMGGNRVNRARRILNVLVTFLLVGLWHGAHWTFVVWGLLHGLYLVVENELRARSTKGTGAADALPDMASPVRVPTGPWHSVLAAVAVFVLVTIAWVFFRAPSLADAVTFFGRGFAHPLASGDHLGFVAPLSVSGGLVIYEWFTRRWEHGLSIRRLALPARWLIYVGLGIAILLFGDLGGQQGIYVQF